MSEIVAEKLIDIESIQFSFNKHFTLTSGLKSPVYVDCRKIISFIDERDFIMNEAVEYFKKNNLNFDLVAGGETAGIPYAAIISEKIKKPMLYVRKKSKGFGKNQQIEGSFKEEQRAILIEDLDKIDFTQISETSAETIRKSVDETQFIIKWVTQPSFLTDETVTPLGTYNQDEILILLETDFWTAEESMLVDDPE